MPKYFYNSGWKKFAQDLLNNKKVYINFIFIDDLNSYRNQLYNTEFSEADLFLFPYDRNEKISTRSFSAQQDIQPYFDQLLSPIINNAQTTFLPFSADPEVRQVGGKRADVPGDAHLVVGQDDDHSGF